MLVKELRQGLRTRSFVGVFLALQGLLGIILLSASAAATSDHAGTTISNIIFLFSSLAVLLIQPMRGVAALSSEVKANTLDMMVLTRLSAWRIVAGKWFAIVTQSALILVTIIPYLILRYFFGGMNLLGEVVLLGLIFLTSATLTAITVGLSASGSVLLRSVLPIIGLPIGAIMLLSYLPGGGNFLVEFCALETRASVIAIAIYLALCAYGGFYLLSIGASLIATYAENHSTLRRFISLVVLAIAVGIYSFRFTFPQEIIFVMLLIMIPAFTISLTEFAPLVSPIYRKFGRFGPLGRLAGPFFLPGWASGVFYCFLLSVIAAIPFLVNPPRYDLLGSSIFAVTALGTLLFPAVLINAFRIKGAQRVANYILFGIASSVVAAVLLAIAETLSNRGFLWLFVWIPPVQLTMLENRYFDKEAVLIASIVITTSYFFLLLILAQHEYRKSIREIKNSLDAESQS